MTEHDSNPIREEFPSQGMVVEEYLQLPPNHKFFDQFPFKQAMDDVAARYTDTDGIASDLAYLTSKVLQKVSDDQYRHPHVAQGKQFDREQHLRTFLADQSKLVGLLGTKRGSKYPSFADPPILSNAITGVFDKLSRYRDWQTYVETRRDSGIYDPDGAHRNRSNSAIRPDQYPPSYLAWANQMQGGVTRIEQGSITAAIQETFPGHRITQQPQTGEVVSGSVGAKAKFRVFPDGRVIRINTPPPLRFSDR